MEVNMLKKKNILIISIVLLSLGIYTNIFPGEGEFEFEKIKTTSFTERIQDITHMIHENNKKIAQYLDWAQGLTAWFTPWTSLEITYPAGTIATVLNVLSFDQYYADRLRELTRIDFLVLDILRNDLATLKIEVERLDNLNNTVKPAAFEQIKRELEVYNNFINDIEEQIPSEIDDILTGKLLIEEGIKLLELKVSIKKAGKVLGIDPESFIFIITPVLNQITIHNKDLFKGDRANVYINQYHSRKNAISEAERKKLENDLVGNYKIHLMPQTDEQALDMVNQIIAATNDDIKLQNSIAGIKLPASYEKVKKLQSKESPGKPEVMPVIVIYPATGQDNAQYVLDKIYQLFKDAPGLDQTPRFNEKVTDLIYYAQGDGDYKKEPWLQYFDASKNYIFYRPDFPDDSHDYELKV